MMRMNRKTTQKSVVTKEAAAVRAATLVIGPTEKARGRSGAEAAGGGQAGFLASSHGGDLRLVPGSVRGSFVYIWKPLMILEHVFVYLYWEHFYDSHFEF